MSTLKIESLDNFLKLWEDMNFLAKFVHRIFEAKRRENPSEKPKFMIGSEIDAGAGELMRPLPGYLNLRVELESNNQNIDYTKYLPNIPKELRTKFMDKEEFTYCREWVSPVLALPLCISKWMISKKVISIAKSVKVTPKAIATGNYLDKLPYDQFILNFSNPLLFNHNRSKYDIKEIIVFKEDNFIFAYPLPPDLEGKTFSPGELAFFDKAMKMNDKGFYKCLAKRAEAEGELDVRRYSQDFWLQIFSPEGEIYWLDKDGSLNLKKVEEDKRSTYIVEIINNVASMLANASPLEVIVGSDLDSPKEDAGQDDYDQTKSDSELSEIAERDKFSDDFVLSWNEVHQGSIQHLKVRNHNGSRILVKSIGTEVSPHYRRAHHHRYHTKNGIVVRWLKRIKVREDKTATESIRGSELQIKN